MEGLWNQTNPNPSRRDQFQQIYSLLKSDLLNDPAFEHDHASTQWLQRMLDYNVPGGKLTRGLSVIDTYMFLKEGNRDQFSQNDMFLKEGNRDQFSQNDMFLKEGNRDQFSQNDMFLKEGNRDQFSQNDIFLAAVLGWCIQWMVGCALVLDDILDNSQTRRGQPCWFRLPKVGIIAVNDGILLWNHINRILRKYFRDQPYYADLLDLFNQVEYQTACGEMMDMITALEGEKDLSKYTPALHRRISLYKTAYGTFYLPVACALLMLGEKLDEYIDVTDILLEMGIYFQVQDDYLDCFGDPDKVGKIGTDIEDFKCSWLVVKALELCNEEQKKVLYDNYGEVDPAKVAIVKSLYRDLHLQAIYAEYEIEVFEKLTARIDAFPRKSVQAVLKSYLYKIHKRQK